MDQPAATLRVLIADDHPLFRDGLKALLLSAPDTQVVGEAASGREAIALAAQLRPQVVLMDLQMPDMDGIQATRQILAANPQINVLMVTMFEDDESVFAAMRAGARGYVLKGARRDEMLRAIRAVGNGEAIFSPGIAARMMGFFATGRPAAAAPVTAVDDAALAELTEREREVLALIAAGKTNAEIAAALTISVKTVRNHVSNILNKLQVVDRAQAALRARDAGLG
ncbi:response regulator transcription factor [Litorilinea aerophila]|uniref:Response regulator transcription factor n=1 Tax=Litorilinea aerophila TaxID=1204385 RepID=A0A540VCF4_9CHLR|nr:response regulator transcription factor [Litorilinea aerophila]MCC9077834.1 response regulator transcription factor [Litorilinea aerophila]OUC06974.1 LuxR family transcriptional regulator [Litorilinea aerophila]GIV78977.1 MAG: DNA-binding response regulator [Litorilinea sp.]